MTTATPRNLRSLTLKAAAQRTGLPAERLRRAVHAGEIAAFRETPKPGRLVRTTFFLLEASLEAWFLARVHGGGAETPDADAAPFTEAELREAATRALDPDEAVLADIPPAERRFS